MAYSGLICTMENFGSTYVTLGDVKKKKKKNPGLRGMLSDKAIHI